MNEAIKATCRSIVPVEEAHLSAAQDRQAILTKPPGSLGELETIGNRVAAICGTMRPSLQNKRMYIVAGDHGVTEEGVSAYPREVTHQMVFNYVGGGAAINVLARHGQIDVQVVDAGVDYDFPEDLPLIRKKIVYGTANFVNGPALSHAQAEQSISTGIDLARTAKQEGIQLLGIGEMGIGNTTSAGAITAVLTECPVEEVTGRGTGIDDTGLVRKIAVIEKAIQVNRPRKDDPIQILAGIGGAEIGVMTGLVIGAAAERLPVVIDGFIATAATALAVACHAPVRDYLFMAHRSQEPGHAALIRYIGHQPILDLGLRLGEGTGVALAMPIIEGAVRLLGEMASFEEAGVSDNL